MSQITEQPVQSKPKTRKLRWYKRDVDAWRGGTRTMSFELKGFYSECLDAMFDLGGCIPSDPAQLAALLHCSPRTVRKLLPQIVALGKLVETPDGYVNGRMMAELKAAGAVKERVVPAQTMPATDTVQLELELNSSGIRAEFDAKNPETPLVSTRDLDPDPESESEREKPSHPEPAREPSLPAAVKELVFEGLGLGRSKPVSPEARRKAAAKLAIANPDPLVALFEAWPRSRAARDADGLFLSIAPKLYRDAAPEVRRACQPMEDAADALAPLRVARPSAALLATLTRRSRHDVYAQ